MDVEIKNTALIFTIAHEQSVREFLERFFVAKKRIHELYMEKELIVNGNSVPPHTTLKIGDRLSLPALADEPIDFIPKQGELSIVYEDEHLLIVNKPAGILVHPDAKDKTGTLCNLVAGYYERTGQKRRVRYIHRLDVETSGGIIFAKHFLAHSYLDGLLAEKKIRRQYLALATGKIMASKGTVNAPIARDRHQNGRRRAGKLGDPAVTHYRVLKANREKTAVELTLETGRTHQIRVHLAHIGHPLLSDLLYGGRKEPGLDRHALHSWKIQLDHPITKEKIKLEIPVPADMLRIWDSI